MMEKFFTLFSNKGIMFLLLYFIIISLVAVFITIYDKRCAIKGQWRISEKTLLIIGAVGGAAAMLITMKKIRHKTKHSKFMIGLPVEIILHISLFVIIIFKYLQIS